MEGVSIGTAAVVATMLVPLISYVKDPAWRTEYKHLLTIAAAIVSAAIASFFDAGGISSSAFIGYLGTAFLTAQSTYTLYFSKTELNSKLEASGTGAVEGSEPIL